MFESRLQNLLDAVENAQGVALLSVDGLVIEALDREGHLLDKDEAFSEYAAVYAQLATLNEPLELGDSKQFHVVTEDALIAIRALTPQYLLAIRAPRDAIPGKVAFYLRIVSPEITREL